MNDFISLMCTALNMLFEGEYRYTKKMVAEFYNVDISTIDRYLYANGDELKHNGYILSKGKQLKDFKLYFGYLINEASKTTQLGLFNFRSFLNIGMLLTESETAKRLRIAAQHIDKYLLERIMQCVIDGTDSDEVLKIDIVNAMSQGELGVKEKD